MPQGHKAIVMATIPLGGAAILTTCSRAGNGFNVAITRQCIFPTCPRSSAISEYATPLQPARLNF